MVVPFPVLEDAGGEAGFGGTGTQVQLGKFMVSLRCPLDISMERPRRWSGLQHYMELRREAWTERL